MGTRSADRLLDQAAGHIGAKDFAAAGDLVRRALEFDTGNVRGLCFQAIVSAHAGRPAEATTAAERALRLAPGVPAVVNNAACVFLQVGDPVRASHLFRQLARLGPPSPSVLNNLALCHLQAGEPDAAEACFRDVLRLDPDHRGTHAHLGNLAKDAGRIGEALALFRQGVARDPADLTCQSNLLYAMQFDPASGPQDVTRQAAAWRPAFEAGVPAFDRYDVDPSPTRRLRVGYVSPNFRDHAETYFVLPLFRRTDRSAVATCVYSCNVADDAVTPLLREHADEWHDVADLDEAALAEAIHRDRIDVLVDLTMHLHGGRLRTFARRPAPVQVAWLAYPGTTGLTRIDYTVLDPHLYRGDDADYSERPFVLPACYWCFEVYGPRPDVSPLPAAGDGGIGRVTFGCLNNFGKVSRPTLAAWADVLRRVPGSRLLLYVDSPAAGAAARAELAGHGVDPQRLACRGRAGRDAYLRTYHEVDIALDPFPYNGATTTCDALWMGVPVVTLAGQSAVSRAGLSLLSNAGLGGWVADSWDRYVEIAVAAASDLAALAAVRGTLRGQLERSPVMDAAAFAAAMTDAYRHMWTRWCTGPG